MKNKIFNTKDEYVYELAKIYANEFGLSDGTARSLANFLISYYKQSEQITGKLKALYDISKKKHDEAMKNNNLSDLLKNLSKSDPEEAERRSQIKELLTQQNQLRKDAETALKNEYTPEKERNYKSTGKAKDLLDAVDGRNSNLGGVFFNNH